MSGDRSHQLQDSPATHASSLELCTTNSQSGASTTSGSFWVLPREIRDEIYHLHMLDCRRKPLEDEKKSWWPNPELLGGGSSQNYLLAFARGPAAYPGTFHQLNPTRLSNLLCTNSQIRYEAEMVMYLRFVICYSYSVHRDTGMGIVSCLSDVALAQMSIMAFTIRFSSINSVEKWRTTNRSFARDLRNLKEVTFEIQISEEEGMRRDLREKWKLCRSVAQPFLDRTDIEVRWVGEGHGRIIADLCRSSVAPIRSQRTQDSPWQPVQNSQHSIQQYAHLATDFQS